ncbi:hypothetical protein G6F32_013313 [Rhizopus arrhizus]|nr:hypothetical protein G6F32_013313 [Rhizopus arrhizus]
MESSLAKTLDPALKKRLADAALQAARSAGATYCDVRIGRYLRQFVITREDKVQNVVNTESTGVGIRVIVNGAWGFAATNALGTADVARAAQQAAAIAKANAGVQTAPVQLAKAPGVGEVSWRTPIRKNAMEVPLKDKVDLLLNPGDKIGLIGANGAGKSTTLLALSGLLPKARGRILFEGEDVTNLAPHQLVARGIVQVPDGRAILTTMTVLENLELGAYRRGLKNVDSALEYVFILFPRLKARITGIAGNLSGGEQQMLAICRALMSKPRILMLDEPSLGLAPLIVAEIFKIIKRWRFRTAPMCWRWAPS